MTEKTISGVHVSPGSAETLVRRGGITNHRLIAYSLSNIIICQKWLKLVVICIEVIVCYVSVVFSDTVYCWFDHLTLSLWWYYIRSQLCLSVSLCVCLCVFICASVCPACALITVDSHDLDTSFLSWWYIFRTSRSRS